jgi:hypothetical protein
MKMRMTFIHLRVSKPARGRQLLHDEPGSVPLTPRLLFELVGGGEKFAEAPHAVLPG